MKKILFRLKASFQVERRQLGHLLGYMFLLKTGAYQLITPARDGYVPIQTPLKALPLNSFDLGKFLGKEKTSLLLEEADKVVDRQITIFGLLETTLNFIPAVAHQHWTKQTYATENGRDIKFIWEPARFAWATILARAYALGADERYAAAFWQFTEEFARHNPPNQGPQWASAQEVALRLIHIAFSYSLLERSAESTPERKQFLAAFLAAHAERLPASLSYAKAQNNNHLISEALGLCTAALLLPGHSKAAQWQRLGWRCINAAYPRQVYEDGRYIQNSLNYQRLILQCGIWAEFLSRAGGKTLKPNTLEALARASHYVFEAMDPLTGKVPNLGHNDGARLLPISTAAYQDYRPEMQAAGRLFLGQQLFEQGPWDELSKWLLPENLEVKTRSLPKQALRITGKHSWASLHAVKHHHPPSHADQLHTELWWQGHAVAQDAGTYLYNEAPPWENSLAGVDSHNTVMINQQDQMLRATRFLYLDWAQADVFSVSTDQIVAAHNGYAKLGFTHQRQLRYLGADSYEVLDDIHNPQHKSCSARLHWLLPDWPWTFKDNGLNLDGPGVRVQLNLISVEEMQISLVRAGKLLHGSDSTAPNRGWVSPTYGVKLPALSLAATIHSNSHLHIESRWIFEAVVS